MSLVPLAALAAFALFALGAIMEMRPAPAPSSQDMLDPTRRRFERGEIDRSEYERIARVLSS